MAETYNSLQKWLAYAERHAPNRGISPNQEGSFMVYKVLGRPDLGEYRVPLADSSEPHPVVTTEQPQEKEDPRPGMRMAPLMQVVDEVQGPASSRKRFVVPGAFALLLGVGIVVWVVMRRG